MGYALSVILTSLQVWAFSLLFDVFFERRYTGKKFYALLALWMAVIIVEANILQNRIGALLFLCEIAAFYLMNVTLYKGSWDRRIFVTVTQYAGAFSISYLTQLLFAFVMSISWEELVNQRALYTGVLFITLIEFFSLPLILRRFHSPLTERAKPHAWVTLGVFFPGCTLFILFMSKVGDPTNTAWLVCLAAMCIVDISLLFLLDQLESGIQSREMLAVTRQRAETQASNIKALTDSYSAQRRLTHDFRKYLFTLSNMLALGKVEDASKYLEQLKVQQTERMLVCRRALRKLRWPCVLELFAQAGTEEQPLSLRPGMVELLHAAANGEADVLVVVDAAHLYCGRPELEGLLASLLHYGIHTFGAKDGNWIEPGGRRWMVLPGYDEEVWNG